MRKLKQENLFSKNFGNEYLPSAPPKFKARKGAQEAHEAIRPTNVELSPEKLKEYLDPAQLRIYTLVYNRFLASQMTPKIIEVTTVTVEGGNYVFVAESRKTKFLGYTILFKKKEEENNGEDTMSLPILREGEKVSLIELKLEQKFTQPPPTLYGRDTD